MIRTDRISFRVGDFHLRDANLEVARGEYFVLLGPPGSGKSVFLECLCGLKRIASGRIFIDGQDVTDLEPRRRGIGYVPQDYALFPHLSVQGNIVFALRAWRLDRRTASRKAAIMADLLGIASLLSRRIQGLSGGEQQRVALARALVIEPKVLLLDEPVSTLDESTREAICAELRRLQRELQVTTIHVSHHLGEAFAVADRAGILHRGLFQQVGPMAELLRKPCNEFVARFMQCENFFRAQATAVHPAGDTTDVRIGEVTLTIPGGHAGEVRITVRPELIHLVRMPASAGPGDTILPVTLNQVIDRGAYVRAKLSGAVELVVHLSHASFAELKAAPGTNLAAILRPEALHVLPKDNAAQTPAHAARTSNRMR